MPSTISIEDDPFAGIEFEIFGLPALPKPCADCGIAQSDDEFVSAEETGLTQKLICRKCWEKRKARPRQKAREEKLRRSVSRLVNAARNDKLSTSPVQEVWKEMMELYGSVKGFVQAWKCDIDAADAGSKKRLDAYYAIFKIGVAASGERQEEIDWSTLTDDEIEDLMASYAYRVVYEEDEAEDEDGKDCELIESQHAECA